MYGEKMFSLIGYTGFVGSNIASSYSFDGLYNTKNITDAFGTKPELLVYAGLRAEKFLANSNPEKDKASIKEAIINIERIKPKRLVLISTIDVYKNPVGLNEDSNMDTNGLLPYGLHRLELERYVETHFDEYLIVRLPGLFGKNIKKNFIYDLIHYIPALLNKNKYSELAEKSLLIKKAYQEQDNGFYKCMCNEAEWAALKLEFAKLGFSALNFTDSRGVFQFYNLANLWKDICIALAHGVKKLNLATEPISIEELHKYLTGKTFNNQITDNPPYYDFRSKYDYIYEGVNGYLYNKAVVMRDIKNFVEGSIK